MGQKKTTKGGTSDIKLSRDRKAARDLFETWIQYDLTGKPQRELEEDFVRRSLSYSAVNLKKETFKLEVEVPNTLYVMFCFLTEDNPGKTVMLFKDLLKSIHDIKYPSGIPYGYRITAEDFIRAFGMDFPLFADPKVDKKYHERWMSEKRDREMPIFSDNQCDYPPYWEGLMMKC